MKPETLHKKISKVNSELAGVKSDLNDLALQIVDDLNISDDLGENYSCFVDKQLYDEFRRVDKLHTQLHEKLNKLL